MPSKVIAWIKEGTNPEQPRYCHSCKPMVSPFSHFPLALADQPQHVNMAAAASEPEVDDKPPSYKCSGCGVCSTFPPCPNGWCQPIWVARANGWLPKNGAGNLIRGWCPACVRTSGPLYVKESDDLIATALGHRQLACRMCVASPLQ